MKFLIALVLAGAMSPALAASNSGNDCISANDMKMIQRDFGFSAMDPEFKISPCESENKLSYTTFKAILFLKSLPHLSTTRTEFRPGFLESDAFGFFKSRIKQVVFDIDDPNFCDVGPSGGTVAYVRTDERNQQIMHVCPYAAPLDVFAISGTLLHEARHIEDYPHAKCWAGAMANDYACDDTYDYGGSYAVGAEYAVLISQTEGLDPALKMRARGDAVADFLERFNKKPFGLRGGAVLQTGNGEVLFFDGRMSAQLSMEVEPGSVLGLRYGLPVVFNGAENTVKAYAFSKNLVQAGGTLATAFMKKFTAAQRAQLVDVIYYEQGACLLFETFIACQKGADEYAEKDLGDIKPVRFVYSPYSVLLPSKSLFLTAEDGRLYEVPSSFEDFNAKDPRDWKKTSAPLNLMGIVPWGTEGDLVLGKDGALALVAKAKGPVKQLPTAKNLQVEKILGPFFWSKKLENL